MALGKTILIPGFACESPRNNKRLRQRQVAVAVPLPSFGSKSWAIAPWKTRRPWSHCRTRVKMPGAPSNVKRTQVKITPPKPGDLWMDEIHFAPPKKPYDDFPVNTNKQWFCHGIRFWSIHCSAFGKSAESLVGNKSPVTCPKLGVQSWGMARPQPFSLSCPLYSIPLGISASPSESLGHHFDSFWGFSKSQW